MANPTEVPVGLPFWVDCNYVGSPGDVVRVMATGLAHSGPNTGNTACNPGGAFPSILPLVGDGAVYGYFAAYNAPASVVNAGALAITLAWKDDGAGPPDTIGIDPFGNTTRNSGVSPITYGFCPGNATITTTIVPHAVPQRLWATVNQVGSEFYTSEVLGGPYLVYICGTVNAPVLTATNQTNPFGVVLSWDNQSGAISYSLYRNGVLLQNLISGTTYTDTTVQQKTTYTYTIYALSACETSPVSNSVVIDSGSTWSKQTADDGAVPGNWGTDCAGPATTWTKC